MFRSFHFMKAENFGYVEKDINEFMRSLVNAHLGDWEGEVNGQFTSVCHLGDVKSGLGSREGILLLTKFTQTTCLTPATISFHLLKLSQEANGI